MELLSFSSSSGTKSVSIFIFGFILLLLLSNSVPGGSSQPSRARNTRGSRHDVRPRNPHRDFRNTARLRSDFDGYYGNEDAGGHPNLAVTGTKGSNSARSLNRDESANADGLNSASPDYPSTNATSSQGANDTFANTPDYPTTNATSSQGANDTFANTQDSLGGISNGTQVPNVGSQANTTLSNSTTLQNGTQQPYKGTWHQDETPSSYSYGSNSSNSSLYSSITHASPVTNQSVFDLPQNGMQKGGIFLGFLPDDGSSGGTRQTMAQLNSDVGSKAAVYGWYAQAHSGWPFDGSQLLAVLDDVKACNCVFQPAIMPMDGWKGLTSQDNSQAVAIAQVLKKFTDEGIPVWLRFAHEMNYYQTDGTYQGTASDFKAGWAAVADAIKNIAPSVKMWWSPNISTAEDYEKYEPDDMSTVDLVGIDFYPKQLNGNDFIEATQDFHDKYAVDGRKFAIGETGLGWNGSLEDKNKWFDQICAAKSKLPQFLSMAWFNFHKEYDYKIAGEPTLNQMFTALIAN